MKLYIETENGLIKNHPALEENLLQAFDTIPASWVPFERVEQPTLDTYEVYEGVTYELVNGVYKDVHHVRLMTNEEKIAKDAEIKQSLSNIDLTKP